MGRSVVDRTGRRYGKLVALELAGRDRLKNAMWLCRCDCGKDTTVRGLDLQSGSTKSCGCLFNKHGMVKPGDRYNKLLVLRRLGATGGGHVKWLCQCDCGKQTPVTSTRLRVGLAASCGCRRKTHGMHSSREHTSWEAMISRCSNPNDIQYKNYGARGITYDPRFRDFEVFRVYMGPRPPGTSLDRIDNSKGYVVGNMRWATPKEQGRNTRTNLLVEYQGEVLCVAELAERLGLKDCVLRTRIRRNWPLHRWAEPSQKE